MPRIADVSNKAITNIGISFLGVVQPEELVGMYSISYLTDCVNILHKF